jgi:hypothetical protein
MVRKFISKGDESGIEFVIDGGGAALTTGVKGYIEVPFDCYIDACVMAADQSGSAVVDIWKCAYDDFDAGSTHPVDADSITASAQPTISTDTKDEDTTLTGWTRALSKGDILAYNVDSAATITRLLVSLKVTKT